MEFVDDRVKERVYVADLHTRLDAVKGWGGASAMLDKLPAIVASGFVLIFVSDIIGNHISFKNRIFNAIITSIVWGILFVALDLLYAEYNPPALVTAGNLATFTVIGVLLAFVSDFIGNMFVFDRRFANAFVTSIIWAVTFTVVAFSYLKWVLEA